ncbi:autotransporter outer membrane beta-barrel domain-containing protein [Candidatus Trichorickettsia mobilis]|uniref:autotransporter outer membrane beta-barrel domain-containing protein n=1 Tax=Candidatus Trichorickettsia mobilis TaxID=1346319 RepID=UPI00292E8465|nr:autotransporter outer membrane beta-barrel domain-containing protein [Candidatus Trichorickettsia mobilis]
MRSSNKLKFLKYLLVATSSLANLSGEAYAANGVSGGNSFLGNNDWGLGRGLQNGDNVRIGQHNSTLRYDGDTRDFTSQLFVDAPNNRAILNVKNQAVDLGNLDINGKNQTTIRLHAIDLSHQDIIDSSGQNKKVDINFVKFNFFENDGSFTDAASKFTINGNDISALGNIYFGNGANTANGIIRFNSAVTYEGRIYSNATQGSIQINNNVVFNNKIGFQPNDIRGTIGSLYVEDNKRLTIKSDVATAEISLAGANARLIVDSTNNNINIYAGINKIIYAGDNEGIIEFMGNRNIEITDIIGDQDNRLAQISTVGNTNITFKDAVFAKNIEVNDGNVIFEKNLDMFSRNMQNIIIDRGTLNFAGDGSISLGSRFDGDITTAVNNTGTINIVKNTDFVGNIGVNLQNLKDIVFRGDHNLSLSNNDLYVNRIRTKNNNQGTLQLAGNRHLQNQIAKPLKQLKYIQFSTADANIQLSTSNIHAINLSLLDAGQTLTVDDNINFAGKITGLGTVDFAGRSTVAQIGEINARVARVRAGTGNVIFNQPIYANIVEINGNSPVQIIDRTLSTNHILLNHQNAQVTVVNGFAAPVAILAAAPGHGRVIFAANGNVGAIGQNGTPVGIVEFQNNAQHTLNSDIYSNNIIFDNGVFAPQNQNIQIVVPQGNIINIPAGWQYVQNALITNAKAQQLAQPPVNHNQQPEVVVNLLQELRQNEQNEPQRLELGVNNNRSVQQQELEVVANQPQELVVNEQNQRENRIIDIEQPVPQIRYTQVDAEVQQQRVVQIKESLIQATSTIIDTSSNVVVHQDTATKTLVSQLTAPVIQNHKNVEDTIRQLNSMGVTFSKAEAEIAKLDAPIGTKTSEQQALLYVVGMTALSPDERKTTMNRMEEAVQAQIKVAEQVTETIHHTIDNRMNELNFNQPEIMVSSGVGVAAGDEAKRKLQGVWARGIYGVSKQRPDKGSAGYNGNSAGGTIGGDFELNEKNIVGIAYSNIRSGFKYKQSRAGDKTTGNSHILSLYGAHQLNDNFSLKTMLAAGMSKITTKRFIMDKIATGKVKNKSYSAEASLNYKIIANENLYFMPNVGLRYAHYRDGAYSERGVGVYNVSVAAKSNNTLTAITGINMMMPQKLSEALVVVPSVHVAVESYLLNKKQKVKAKLAWMDSYFENNASLGAKSAKFSYNLGGGIVAKYNNIEVSANYNCNLRKKYQNHQGTVKLKILF